MGTGYDYQISVKEFNLEHKKLFKRQQNFHFCQSLKYYTGTFVSRSGVGERLGAHLGYTEDGRKDLVPYFFFISCFYWQKRKPPSILLPTLYCMIPRISMCLLLKWHCTTSFTKKEPSSRRTIFTYAISLFYNFLFQLTFFIA